MPGAQTEDDVVIDDQIEDTSTEENLEDEVVDEPTDDGESTEEIVEESTDEPEDEDGLVISLDGEEIVQEDEEHKNAPTWVKELRKSSREKDKKIRELEAKLNAGGTAQKAQEVKLPAKPKLEDFDYDPDIYEEKLGEWYEQKRRYDAQVEAAKKAQEEADRAWQEKLATYNKTKTELKVKDYEEAESFVQDRFSVTQQGIILQGLENPALVVYALGKNHKKAAELAGNTDPVRFAVAVGKLETQLKVTTRKSPPPPPRSVTGTARVSGAVDSTLDRLRAEAEKTGDYTKVLRYKQQKKKAG